MKKLLLPLILIQTNFTMKKITLLLVITVMAFTGCKSDDDGASGTDPLIGTWTLHQELVNGQEQTLDDCDKMETIIVNANGTYTEKYFYEANGTCEIDATDVGIWENLGNSVYRVTYDAGTPEEESYEIKITFDGNTFFVEVTEGQITYKDVYIKK